MFFSRQCLMSSLFKQYGWTSIWLTTGWILAFATILSICSMSKLLTPIDFVKPASTNFSISFHVSSKSTFECNGLPSASFGNNSSDFWYPIGQWIKYKSKYPMFNCFKVWSNATRTSFGSWKQFHNLLVTNSSSLKYFFFILNMENYVCVWYFILTSSQLLRWSSRWFLHQLHARFHRRERSLKLTIKKHRRVEYRIWKLKIYLTDVTISCIDCIFHCLGNSTWWRLNHDIFH